MMEGNLLIFIFILSLAALFFLILKLKIDPFISLIVVAFLTALVIGFAPSEIPVLITEGFGSTLVGVGILIGLGVIFGQLLGASGAIEKIAEAVLKVFGIKRSPAGLSITGVAVSIPVFFDAAFVILSGLVKSLTKKTGISIVSFVTALGVGLIVAHSMIAPTPGPMIVAENTGADLGLFIVYGLICAIPATLVGGYIYGMAIGKKIKPSIEDIEAQLPEKLDKPKKEISTGLSFFLLALPIALILLNTISGLWIAEGSTAASILGFIGDKNVALLISVLTAIVVLRPYISTPYSQLYSEAISSGGMIILVTGAGGAFGAVINESGIGDYLVETMQSWSIPVVLLVFIFSQILRASLGSATVALVTTSTIMGPMAADLGISPVLMGLAICAGAIGLSLPNDSGFWVVNKFGRLTIPQTIQAWTIGGFIAGLTALAMVLVLSLFSGILPGL
ncbi:gluconate:H+ symporter, GntP family [Alteribacillus persepolensis]|uniref:Gluconate:H+ symporter, GntP family n=1 Tax=Alteribacillus persepolensis TaxID=568899 RepID=A0A1G8FT20_9BACI|nr:gluconate:H+ symporter [Alteribacillus persepolensis]SDH85247.1 gluconate:H+ symporter, GntP family [Alteribacillus persepolensis]